MRRYHALAVAAVVLIGFGVKLFFFSGSNAEADGRVVTNSVINISKMHADHSTRLPATRMQDMTFVFSRED